MAKRKRKTTTRRRKRGMSEGMAGKVRRKRRRSGMSSNALSTKSLVETGKELLGGGLGGYAAGHLNKMSSSYTPMQKTLAFGLSAFAAHMFGWKNVGAGIAGAYGYAMQTQQPGFSEDNMEEHDYTDKDALSEMCDAMDEDGNPLFLSGGQYYTMEEIEDMEEDEDGMSAQLLADEYPSYINSANY